MIKHLKITNGLAINVKSLLAEMGFNDQKILLVSDENILHNCATFFGDALDEVFVDQLILQNPKADEENVNKLLQAAQGFDLIMALGSGTISDLCKFTAAKRNIPYAIFPSAPSMNGYLSKNASITINGHKKTLPATLPIAVFCDLDILQSAPEKLIKAGIGDSFCFYSCWFDWYLSNAVLGTYFDESLLTLLKEKMDFLVQHYTQFSLQDEALLKLLIEILLLSGDAMTKAGGSYPASQSEHLIAHVLDMKYPEKMKNILHGEQIAVTTLIVASFQEKLLEKEEAPQCVLEDDFEDALVTYFGKTIASECIVEFAQKNEAIKAFFSTADWPLHRQKLSAILFKQSNLQQIFQHFNMDISCEAFGLTEHQFQEAVGYAKFIRNRFTCLDIR